MGQSKQQQQLYNEIVAASKAGANVKSLDLKGLFDERFENLITIVCRQIDW